jgi:hypothetical protein
MTIELDELLKSKIYVPENRGVNFDSPRRYVEPFLEKFKAVSGVTYDVQVSGAVENMEENETLNSAYARVLVEAKLPQEFDAYEHSSVIGMVYALDIIKPNLRVYSGEDAWACLNLCIFGAQNVFSVDLTAGISPAYERASDYVIKVSEQLAKFQKTYERMNDVVYKGTQIDQALGYLLRESYANKSIGTNAVLSALKDLESSKSRYAIKDGTTTQWNMYSAITQYITDKVDIKEKAEKTQMVSNLFHGDLLSRDSK